MSKNKQESVKEVIGRVATKELGEAGLLHLISVIAKETPKLVESIDKLTSAVEEFLPLFKWYVETSTHRRIGE